MDKKANLDQMLQYAQQGEWYSFWKVVEKVNFIDHDQVEKLEHYLLKNINIKSLSFMYNIWQTFKRKGEYFKAFLWHLGHWIESIALESNENSRAYAESEKTLSPFFFWSYFIPKNVAGLVSMHDQILLLPWTRAEETDPGFPDKFYCHIYTKSGVPVMLERPDMDDPRYIESGFSALDILSTHEILSTKGHFNERNMWIENVLWELGVKRDQIDYVCVDFSFVPCRILRQDDNGNEFEMQRFESHLEGRWMLREFNTLKHKQSYWLEAL